MNAKNDSYVVSYGDFRVQDWLLNSKLSGGAKLTYSLLACCAGGKDHAWPSQDYLAEKASVSKRTIQRYLNELINGGLIEKARKWIKGQVRCVYRFLITTFMSKSVSSCPQGDNLSSSPAAEILLTQPAKATNCPKRRDNLSPSLIKEETNKGKEIPPSPQKQADEVFGKKMEGDFFQITGFEESYQNPEWLKVKGRLKDRLSEQEFETWIEPLIFESVNNQAVLRVPNAFFLSWLKNNFGALLDQVFQENGFSALNIDLYTEQELKALNKTTPLKSTYQALVTQPSEPTENFENLSAADQFERLWQAYPVKKDRDKAWEIFRRLARSGKLPELTEMIKSIKNHMTNDRWWRERMPPLLKNWLAAGKWQDQPFE